MVASFFFSEYGGYIGAPFVLLALIGAIGDVRKSFPWVLGAIFFLMLYRGDTGPNAPTMWLRHLPLGGNIGLCGRWVIPLVFCVGVLAALGAQSLCERPQQWGRRLAGYYSQWASPMHGWYARQITATCFNRRLEPPALKNVSPVQSRIPVAADVHCHGWDGLRQLRRHRLSYGGT